MLLDFAVDESWLGEVGETIEMGLKFQGLNNEVLFIEKTEDWWFNYLFATNESENDE